MKKIIGSVLVLVMVLSALSVAAFAATDERNFYRDLTWETGVGYYDTDDVLGSSNGPVQITYEAGGDYYVNFAFTKVRALSDQTGRASTQINSENGDIQVGSATTKSGGYITHDIEASGEYALKVNHYANRRTGSTVDMWNYWVYNNG